MALKKLSDKKKPNPYARKILVQLKVNPDEMKFLLGRAHSLTGGNISAFLRAAAFNYKPSKADFEK